MAIANDDLPEVPVLKKGIYEHYKGMRYEVIGTALHSETLEPVVVYKPLYESKSEYWVRPYDMFIETIEKDGETFPRFKKVNE